MTIVDFAGKQYIEVLDNDPFHYRPIKHGIGPSSAIVPNLRKDGSPKGQIFQFDDQFRQYQQSKHLCYKHAHREKFYQQSVCSKVLDVRREVTKTIINSLLEEYPQYFKIDLHDGLATLACRLTHEQICYDPEDMALVYTTGDLQYKDLFDALAFQVQEDMAVITNIDGIPTASIIHLHHPNSWSANAVIGQSFSKIHEEVKHRNEQLVVKRPDNVAAVFCSKPVRLERVGAISFRTSGILEHHPDNSELESYLSYFDKDDPKLIMRFERQTIQGLPGVNSFLFTIKTYMYDVFAPGREQEMIEAFSNIDENVYSRWFTDQYAQDVLEALHKRKQG